MQISRKADYALRAMTILASMPPERSMLAQDLAVAGDIPLKFLEQILLALKKSGLVLSKRGKGGGSRLSRDRGLISLAEIVESIDGELCQLSGSETPSTSGSERFSGEQGMSYFLGLAAEACNERLRKTSLEDVALHAGRDDMAGYGI